MHEGQQSNDSLIHDYIHHFLKDPFDKNKEVLFIKSETRNSYLIFKQLNETTPDFVLKRKDGRPRYRYVGDQPISEIKVKYRTLPFLSDSHFIVVMQHDFPAQLRGVLPSEDLNYMHRHFQVFQTEYHFWKSCPKLKKVMLKEGYVPQC